MQKIKLFYFLLYKGSNSLYNQIRGILAMK